MANGYKKVGPRRFLLLVNRTKRRAVEKAKVVQKLLESRGAEIDRVEATGEALVEDHNAEMAVVLGGDGAILRAAYQMGRRPAPALGVNLGRLGFLADLDLAGFHQSVDRILAGEFAVTRHVVLECRVEGPNARGPIRVLNEVVVSAGPPFKIIDVELRIDGEEAAVFSGDGLIISTPIGSTAHNLAAGGPILAQTIPAVVVTPICPHTLTWRPVVESADRRFELQTLQNGPGGMLIVDGHIQIPLSSDDRVLISRSDVDFPLVRLPGRSYYATLSEKLHWGNRLV